MAEEPTGISSRRSTPREVLDICRSGEFSSLIGIAESEIEFKGEPYRLGALSQKVELAKDVAALANDEGGLIVIGVRTEKHDCAI